jgi:putative ABC transport system permease protein
LVIQLFKKRGGPFHTPFQDFCNLLIIYSYIPVNIAKAEIKKGNIKWQRGGNLDLIKRSIRDMIRSPGRSIIVILILAVCLGLALTMFEVNAAITSQLGTVSESVGTDISVRPAGSFGGFGGNGTLLSQADVDKLGKLNNVASVQESVMTQYAGSSLQPVVPQRTNAPQGANGGIFFQGGAGFNMPILINGLDTATQNPVLMGQASVSITQGRYFVAGENDASIAVIGKSLADTNSLAVGSKIDIQGTSLEVVGIYSSGQVFGDSMIVMPIGTVKHLFNLDGVSSVTVVADDVNNVDSVVTEIRTIFDTNTADVVTAKDMYDQISSSITNAGSSSQTGMIVSFIVAAAVIILSVVLLVRQRIRQIGILKAIGASNRQIALQFGFETVGISLIAALIGTCITFLLSQSIANMFVSSPGSGAALIRNGGAGGGFAGGGMLGASRMFTGSFAGIHVAVSPEVFLIAIVSAIVLAIIASVVPVWYIARVKPAEVLRNE